MSSVLDQTYADFELVVVDKASPDDTGEIARSFRGSRVPCLGYPNVKA
jgi:glycosyltransferase involved in cell wall biosynthesis